MTKSWTLEWMGVGLGLMALVAYAVITLR